jgi:DNA-binding NtrC family response regulator
MPTVLLVDDDPSVLFTLSEALDGRGHSLISAGSGEEALTQLEAADVVVTDLAMPGMDGLALLSRVRAFDPDIPVVLITAHGSERIAVSAMKSGAYDYIAKPFGVDEVRLAVARALETRALRRSARALAVDRALGREIVGKSPVFARVVAAAERLAPRDVTVLVRGETGTGKELIAGVLHAASPRASAPLVRFSCAAVPSELAEAELFGHVKGAFTGAIASRRGFFAEADKGTLVLDEIGELPLSLQPKLLRVLQNGEVQPVGSGKVEKVDVRIVASTHRDLAAEVRAGRFREDLYYRLAVVELVVPPLRERREDIPLLVEAFRRRFAQRFALGDVTFTPDLVDELCRREWPGNVRELENTVARLLALSTGGPLDATALSPTSAAASGATPSGHLRERVAAFERSILERTLDETSGNQSEAARRLGITRVGLIDKMKRFALGPYSGRGDPTKP